MTLFAVYFIYEDGRVLLAEVFQSENSAPNPWMMSGLLVTFKNMALELTKHSAKVLHLGNLYYHIEDVGNFLVVLVSNAEERPDKLLNILGSRFASLFGVELVNWNGYETVFHPFKSTITEILNKHTNLDISASINPSKSLTADEIYLMPKAYRNIALAFLNQSNFKYSELVSEFEPKGESQSINKALSYLMGEGFIGIKSTGSEMEYFCIE